MRQGYTAIRMNRRDMLGGAGALSLSLAVGPSAFAQTKQAVTCESLIGTEPLIWRLDNMTAYKTALKAGDLARQNALDDIIASAEKALTQGPYSVADKTRPPPSGDIKDYTSIGPYWWPNPNTKDGLPYVRRDGQTNPERENGDYFDRRRMQNMIEDVTALSLAAFYTDDPRYGRHAVSLLDVWFVNTETRKNPNLNYGQAIPGKVDGRGIGIIDTRLYVDVIDSAQLLGHLGLLPETTRNGLKLWFRDYTKWLVTNELGLDERGKANNHGTYYDLQVVAFALFIGNCSLARRILNDTRLRIAAQITKAGKMPLEQSRTRSLHYHIFNAQAFFKLARLGEHIGEDIYNFTGPKGQSILKSLNYLAGFARREDSWPYEQIGRSSAPDLYDLLRIADTAVQSRKLSKGLNAMPDDFAARPVNLLY